MKFSQDFTATTSLAVSLFITRGVAQYPEPVPGTYTDAATNITFATTTAGPFTFGIALPQDAATKNATEYIGMLRCQGEGGNSTGWCGLAHAGHMTNDLLLMAWPYQSQVLTSFRFIGDYFFPPPYTGSASLTQIRSSVNATGFEVLYRCQGCFSWSTGNYSESADTATGDPLLFGYAIAAEAPKNAGCPNSITFGFHQQGFGQWAVPVENATQASYSKWTSLATKAVNGSCAGTGSASSKRSSGFEGRRSIRLSRALARHW